MDDADHVDRAELVPYATGPRPVRASPASEWFDRLARFAAGVTAAAVGGLGVVGGTVGVLERLQKPVGFGDQPRQLFCCALFVALGLTLEYVAVRIVVQRAAA